VHGERIRVVGRQNHVEAARQARTGSQVSTSGAAAWGSGPRMGAWGSIGLAASPFSRGHGADGGFVAPVEFDDLDRLDCGEGPRACAALGGALPRRGLECVNVCLQNW
jgi:hypothetical protein